MYTAPATSAVTVAKPAANLLAAIGGLAQDCVISTVYNHKRRGEGTQHNTEWGWSKGGKGMGPGLRMIWSMVKDHRVRQDHMKRDGLNAARVHVIGTGRKHGTDGVGQYRGGGG